MDPILISRTDAPGLLGIGQRTFDRWEAAGLIGPRPVRIGGRKLYNAAELRRWAASAHGDHLPTRDEWVNRLDTMAAAG